MGNSPSSRNSHSARSKRPAIVLDQQWGDPYHGLKRSTSLASHNLNRPPSPMYSTMTTRDGLLAVPGNSHRRTQSAMATVGRRTPSADDPPPSYTPPLPEKDTPVLSSRLSLRNGSGSLGSSYTSVAYREPSSSNRSNPSLPTFIKDTNRSTSYLAKPMRKETQENALEMLRQFDTVILVDDSTSMCGDRWSQAAVAIAELAYEAGKYDADGIDLYFLNSRVKGTGLRDPEAVRTIFHEMRPKGITPIAARLEELTKDYMDRLEASAQPRTIKPVNFIVITDGEPTDDPESVIRALCKRLDKRNWPLCQLGIQFVQIGTNQRAKEYLQSLDEELTEVRDIVETIPYNGHNLSSSTIIQILLGAVNRRVDRKGGTSLLPR